MPRLIKDLFGVRAGQVHPEIIPAGEQCPPELLDAAAELGCLAAAPKPSRKKGRP